MVLPEALVLVLSEALVLVLPEALVLVLPEALVLVKALVLVLPEVFVTRWYYSLLVWPATPVHEGFVKAMASATAVAYVFTSVAA
jgi:hypothetical protein